MKIRLDFVTNSSSSSFTCVAMYSEKLYSFLQKIIDEGKNCEQPKWARMRPKNELHLTWIWEELKLDERWYKVQTTEEYGDTDENSIYKYICYFFDGLTSDEERTLKELIHEVYRDHDYQTHRYKDQTDGFVGFNFGGGFRTKNQQSGEKDKKIQKLKDKINEMAIDPETAGLSMRSIAVPFELIDGHGIYDPESERYQHIDKEFLRDVKLGWVDSDYTEEYKKELLLEERRKKWGKHLRKMYEDAIDETGALRLWNISSRCDFAVVPDAYDGVLEKYSFENYLIEYYNLNSYDGSVDRLTADQLKDAKKSFYRLYLSRVIGALKEANHNKDKRQTPVRVIWESQLHDYLMHHTSLGNKTPEPVVGPNGTIRRKVPENHKKTIDHAVKEMLTRWPSRVINPKTRTYDLLLRDITGCCADLGYANADEFFDAYGFSIKQDTVSEKASKVGDYAFEKKGKNEVTVVQYIGEETEVIIPETIDGGIVKVIGKDAFNSNNKIEAVFVPESVDTIRGKAFAYSKNLKKVHLSDNIEKLVAGTFDGCDHLEEINIPDKVQDLPAKLFRDCPIKRLHIGKSLSEVDKDVFYGGEVITDENYYQRYVKTSAVEFITIDPENKNLKSEGPMLLTCDGKVLLAMLGDASACTIPEGVEIIADKAFARQGLLKEVSFPDSLWLVGNNAFESTGLETVSFPQSLKTIGAGAFKFCKGLKNVNFSEGLEKIYNEAFLITGVRRVVFPASLKKLGKHSFDGWHMESVEPSRWKEEIQRWGSSFTQETVKTDHYIRELKIAGRKAAAAAQLDNKVGLGLLAAMMSFLQSDAANSFDVGDRLKLERIVISKEMEAVLGTDLKLVLSYYKYNATEKLGDCLRYLKAEADQDSVNEYYERIKMAFPKDNEVELLLDGTDKMIREEA